MKTLYLYNYLVLLAFLSLAPCTKDDKDLAPSSQAIAESLDNRIIKNITGNSVEFQYSLPITPIETSIYISVDSAALASPTPKGVQHIVSHDEQFYSLEIKALTPYTKYWYRVEIKTQHNGTTHSKVLSFITGTFNLRWQEGFSRKLKLTDLMYDNLVLIGQDLDLNTSEYAVQFGDLSYAITKIVKAEGNSREYKLIISVPWNIQSGKRKFAVFYKNRKVFKDEIEIEQGNTFDAVKVTESARPYAGDNVYFKYNEKLYSINLNRSVYEMYIWSPLTNTWDRKDIDPKVKLWRNMKGQEINGKIYFSPYAEFVYIEELGYSATQERLYAYDPMQDSWEFYTFNITKSPNDWLRPLETFVYQDKLYCVVSQGRYTEEGPVSSLLLKVFDPISNSFEEVMDMSGLNAWGVRAITTKGKIYVAVSEEKSQSMATVNFNYALYELDLTSKNFIRKADVGYGSYATAALDPAIFEHGGHIYLYGGNSSIGYFGSGSDYLYRYTPATNSWTWLRPLVSNLPSTEHFGYVLNSKIYVGLGLTSSTRGTREIYELKILDL